MTLTTKIVRQYQCCGQVMPVPVVIKQIANYRRPMPICQPFYLPSYPQPYPPPYQQYRQPYPPHAYQQQAYQQQAYQQQAYQQQAYQQQYRQPYQQPYTYQPHAYPQPYQQKEVIQSITYDNTSSAPALLENKAIDNIQTHTMNDNKKESDTYYRIPPSYPIVEYSSDISVLTGNIVIQTTDTVPDGYLLCDGSDVSRETESDLFNVIGTFYGEGDESTTFCLPDLEDDEQPTHHYLIKR